MGVRAVTCLSLFICLFIYLFREYLSGFFYHCVSIVISFNFISLVIHFIVELGVGYRPTGVKNHFFVIFFLQQFFCIPFTLSQHAMTKFLAWGLRKKCARPKSKMAAVFPQKSHFQP